MGFLEYISRKLVGLPGIESDEVIAARSYNPAGRPAIAETILTDSSYDLNERPLDLFTYGAISPQPNEEDSVSSEDLHKLAEEARRSFGVD